MLTGRCLAENGVFVSTQRCVYDHSQHTAGDHLSYTDSQHLEGDGNIDLVSIVEHKGD